MKLLGTHSNRVLVALLSIFALSCNNNEAIDPTLNPQISIDEAKNWFEDNIENSEGQQISNGRTGAETREPHWDFAKVVRLKNKDVVSVPLKFKEGKKHKRGSLSKVIISKDTNGKMKLEVLKAIGNSSYLKQSNNKIGFKDFSGMVIRQDWNGNYLGGEYYVSGKPIAKLEKPVQLNNSSGRTNGVIYILVEVVWIQSTYVNGELVSAKFLESTYYYKVINTGSSYSDAYGTYYSWGDGGGGGGGLGGGGGGGSCPNGPYSPDCNEPIPFDSGEVVVDIEEVRPPDPCKQADLLETNDSFKAKMTELASKTNLNYETGFNLTNTATGYSYSPISGSANAAMISFNLTSPIDGFIHSHYTGTFSTFSGSDVKAIFDIYQNGLMNDPNTFTAGVVTSQGTSYTMMIENLSAFLNFSQLNLTGSGFQAFEGSYDGLYDLYKNLFGKSEIEARELALLKALEGSGIKVFKGNSAFNDWKAVENHNNQVTNVNCN
jgi:hypothetical protein